MSLKKLLSIRSTLAFRLTLWYLGIFTLLMSMALSVFYLVVSAIVHQRRDADLLDDVRDFAVLFATGGLERVKEEMTREALSDGVEDVFLRLLTPAGGIIASTDVSLWGASLTPQRVLQRLNNGAQHVLMTLTIPGREYRARVVYGRIHPGIILQIGESLEADEELLQVFQSIFVPAVAVVVLLATGMGWLMAKRALTDVEKVTKTALQISQGAFDNRVPVKARGDEIARLAHAFNVMLDRISCMMKEMKEMTDCIAHDLRSPLTRIRGAAEMTLTTATSLKEHQAVAASIVEECDRLLGMIDTLLDIAEIESQVKLPLEDVDIAEVVREACELFWAIGEEKCIIVTTNVPARCMVKGEPRKLQRLVANLLDNALKYTPPRGQVTVSVGKDDHQVFLSVADTGIGIAAEDLPHIFERFYRCNRHQSQQGSGLGLSLVRAIARSLGGDVSVESQPGQGSIFTVRLLASPENEA